MDETDIIGQRFGRLTVEEYIERDKKCRIWYRCRCECGKETLARRDALMAGSKKTCGDCSRIEREGDHYRYYCHRRGSFIFDECDLPLVKSYRWLIDHNNYVRGVVSGSVMNEFSRVALDAPENMFVDHVNGDTTDNRRVNLRLASEGDNVHNIKLSRRNTSGYKGVRKEARCSSYRASIVVNNKWRHLGSFKTAEEAACAYDEAARKYFGEFACVNFPLPGEQGCRERAAV